MLTLVLLYCITVDAYVWMGCVCVRYHYLARTRAAEDNKEGCLGSMRNTELALTRIAGAQNAVDSAQKNKLIKDLFAFEYVRPS